MKHPKYNWLFFDVDNTLLDFSQSQVYALEQSFHDAGLAYQPDINTVYTQINHQCWQAFEAGQLAANTLKSKRFELLLAELQLTADAQQMGKNYLQHLSTTDYLMPEAREVLDYLRPKYQLAVITNGLQMVQRPRLKKAQLTDYFEAIVVSEEIGYAKPDARFFDVVFDQTAAPRKEEVLVIGDSLNSDIKGGNNYGLDTCWVNPQQQSPQQVSPTLQIRQLQELIDIHGL